MDVVPDKSATTSPSSHESRALVGHVTCVKKTMVYVENKISFSISRVIEGMVYMSKDTMHNILVIF